MLGTAKNGVRLTKLANLTKKPNLQYAVVGSLTAYGSSRVLTIPVHMDAAPPQQLGGYERLVLRVQ
jgi:hypothetical protein